MEWNIILDVALVVIILLTLLINTKRGFFKTLLKAVRTVAVIVLALLLTPTLSGVVADAFVNDMVDGQITAVVSEAISENDVPLDQEISIPAALEGAGGFEGMLPEGVELPMDVNTLLDMIDSDGAIATYEGTLGDFVTIVGGRLEALASLAISSVITYLALSLVFFIILTIVVNFLSKKLKGITVLNKVDHVLGFVWGLIVSYFWVSLITFIVPLVDASIMEGTVVAGFLSQISIFTLVLEPILAEVLASLPL